MEIERKYVVLENIKYDLDGLYGYKLRQLDSGRETLPKEELLKTLPETLKFHSSEVCFDYRDVNCKEDFIRTLNKGFRESIEQETGWLCIGFSYKFKTKN